MRTPPRLLLGFALLGLWLGAAPARATLVTGLYEARVPVADQSSAQRNSALQQAFAAVLVKVTGNRAAPSVLAGVLGNPSQYVQQYRYEQAPPDPASPSVQAAQPPALVLWAKFDPGVVDKALHAAHAALWGPERPRTLVLIALQNNPAGRILAASDDSYLMQALATAAQQRGLAVVFPQMDSPDKGAFGVPDLTGFNLDRIHAAAARYKPDSVLVGSVTPFGSAGQFSARWQLLSADRAEGWDTPAGDETLVAVDGIEVAADRDAARYAIAPDAVDLNGVPLEVDGVTSLDAYAKVLGYVGSLTPVRAVHVQRVAQGSAFFSVDIHGSLDNLEAALSLGGLLVPTAPAPTTPSPGTAPAVPAPLRYSYSP